MEGKTSFYLDRNRQLPKEMHTEVCRPLKTFLFWERANCRLLFSNLKTQIYHLSKIVWGKPCLTNIATNRPVWVDKSSPFLPLETVSREIFVQVAEPQTTIKSFLYFPKIGSLTSRKHPKIDYIGGSRYRIDQLRYGRL